MSLLSRRWFWWSIGIVIGGIAGYIYHVQWGCTTGSCKITSDPTNSTIYGSLVGVFLFDGLKKKDQLTKESAENEKDQS